jgi:hypothetical protein
MVRMVFMHFQISKQFQLKKIKMIMKSIGIHLDLINMRDF